MSIEKIIYISAQALLLAALAPLVSGFIRKIKNNFRMRKGASMLQQYYNVLKLFAKDEVISHNASWVFYAAPAAAFLSSICALALVLAIRPVMAAEYGIAMLLAVFFVLALGRFFLALAGLDAAGSFGGMGSSREMFISSLAEPAVFTAAFALLLPGGCFKASALLAGVAVAMVTIAETSRVPVDNQETHLELTMVHEAMVLEYSGRSLALIELSSHIKQMVFFILLSWYIFPHMTPLCLEWALFPAKIAVISVLIVIIELSVAKMRLFRVVDFLSFAFFIALLASVAAGLGL